MVGKILTILFSFFLFSAFAEESNYSTGEIEFRNGNWEKASAIFRDLAQKSETVSGANATQLYNLGTSLIKAGKTAEAYLILLKAQHAAPLDSDIRYNLAIAKQKLSPNALAVVPAAWFSFSTPELHSLPKETWFFIGLCLIFTALFLRLLNMFLAGVRACFLVAGLFLLFGGLEYWQTAKPMAGTVSPLKVKSGPDQTFPEIISLDGGALVNIEELRDKWRKIRFQIRGGQESVGWVEDSQLLRIE